MQGLWKAKPRTANLKKRDEILGQLDKAFVSFNELKGNLREGTEFYTNFKDILVAFRTRCKDFAYARGSEKADILRQLQSMVSGYTTQQMPQSNTAPYASQYPIPGGWQPHMPVLYQTQPLQPNTSFQPFSTYYLPQEKKG